MAAGPARGSTGAATIVVVVLAVAAHAVEAAFNYSTAYSGCYEDPPQSRYFSLSPGLYNCTGLLLNSCRDACTQTVSNSSYAILSNGQYCFCSTSYDANATAAFDCTAAPCSDGQPCGGAVGSASVSVYTLRATMPTTATVTYFSSNALGLLAYSAIAFSVYPSSSNFSYSLDFFDGTSALSPMASVGVVNYFSYPGTFEVTAAVSDAENNTVTGGVLITVAVGLQSALLTCPTFATSTVQFNCTLTVFGTHMYLSVNFNDGDTRADVSLGSSSVSTLGQQTMPAGLGVAVAGTASAPVLTVTPPGTVSGAPSQGNLYLMVNKVINSWGRIYSWEFTVVTAGQLVLQVYRPTCTGGLSYCYYSDSCAASCSAETGGGGVWANRCSGSGLGYSVSSRGCYTEAGQKTWLISSTFARPQLTLVGETVVTVLTTGLQKIILNDTTSIAVQPGDTVALYEESCTVAVQPLPLPYEVSTVPDAPNWTNRVLYAYAFPVASGQADFQGAHSVVVRILNSATMVLQKTYEAVARSAGSMTYNVTQTVTGAFTNSSLSSTVSVQVQDAVRNVAFNAPSYAKTNSTYSFTVITSAGTSLRYIWWFGDSTDPLNGTATTNSTMLHAYTSADNYTLTVMVYNDVSEEQAQFNITVEDVVIGLEIFSGVNATLYRDVTALTFTIQQGTSTIYSIVTADGGSGQKALLCPNGTMTPATVDATYGELQASYNYTFPLIGNWSVTVNASNHVSWAVATIYLPVQISISDLIIVPPAVIPYEDTGFVDFYLVNGSHVTFLVAFDDTPARSWSVSAYLGLPTSYAGRAYLALSEYNRTRNHTLTVSAWNLVTGAWVQTSESVWVDYRVQDVKTVPNTTFLQPDDPVSLNVTMLRGSRFTSVVTYGDGLSESVYEEELLSDGFIMFVHSFAVADNYTVVMNATNAVTSCACANNTLKMIVQNPAAGLHLATNSPVSIPNAGTGLAVLTLSFDGTVLPPTDAFVLYTMGDTPTASSRFSHYLVISVASPVVDTYVYSTFGTYNISLNVSNFVSYQFFQAVIDVDQVVLNLAIASDLQLVVFNVTVVQFTISMTWGSRVLLTWNWLDDTASENAPYEATATNMKRHTYAKVGVYYTQAIAVNTVGETIAALPTPVIVQQPVTGFVLIPDKARAVISGPDWYYTMPFHLFETRGVPLCTNATFQIDYGDGNFSSSIDLNGATATLRNPSMDNGSLVHVLTFTHKYYVGAIYNINISIWNLVSAGWYPTTIKMYEQIAGLHGNVTLLYNVNGSSVNLNDSKVTQRPGYGAKADYFPLDMCLFVQTWFSRGVFLSYLWDFGDGNGTALNYQIPSASYQYAAPGTYTIFVTVFNDMVSTNLSWVVHIQRRVGPVNITSIPASPIRMTTSFMLWPGWIGTDACYYVNLIDTTSAGSHQRFLGSEDTCTEFFSTLMQLGMVSTWMTVDAISKDVETSGGVEIENTYNTNNVYHVKLLAINKVSNATFYEKIAVTTQYCLYPAVDLQSVNPCLTKDLCDDSMGYRIKKQYKGFKWYVDSSVVIDCDTTSLASYMWQIYVVNVTTGEETPYTGDMSVFAAPSPRQLTIPALSLDYGLYRFELNVTMFIEIGLTSTDSVRVFVVRSPLVGGITGGEYRRKGFGSNVTFDAIQLTGDPDNPNDKSGFRCRWMCRRYCETWPQYDSTYTTMLNNGTSTCPPLHLASKELDPTLNYSTGGCFKLSGTTQAGFFPPDLIIDPTGCTIMQDFWYAYEGQTIYMKVLITNGPRLLEVDQTVDVAYGDPPEITAVCSSNCGTAVNYNAKLAYVSVISMTPRGIEYVYSWRLLVNRNGSDYKEAIPMPLDEWAPMNTTGIDSSNIAIDAFTFRPSDGDGSYFFLEVSAYRSDGNASNYGRNYKSFVINNPPAIGNCSVYPSNGTALETLFNTKCDTPFSDPDVPMTYMIGASTMFDPSAASPNYDGFKVLAAGVNSPSIPGSGSILPEGVGVDYTMYILIRCYDSLGAWTNLVTTVQVLPPSAGGLSIMMQSIREGSGAMQNYMASKDLGKALNTMTAVMGSMDTSAAVWNETDAQQQCLAEAAVANSTGLISGNQTFDSYVQLCIARLKDVYDAQQQAVIGVKEKAMQMASSLPQTTVNDANQALSFISSGTANPEHMTADSLPNAHAVMQTSISLMVSETNLDPLAKIRMCNLAVSGMGNMMLASSQQLKQQNSEMLALNGTASASLTGSAAASNESQSTMPSMATLQAEIDATLRTVGGVLLENIVTGEAPTTLESDKMTLIVQKAFASSAGASRDLSGGKLSLNMGGNNSDEVHSQIAVHKFNPLVAQNETSSGQWSVSSNVVQMNLHNSSGAPVDLDNVTAPTHVIMSRDPSQVSVTKIVGTTVSIDSSVRMTTYKVLVPAYSSLSLSIRQLINATSNATSVAGGSGSSTAGGTLQRQLAVNGSNSSLAAGNATQAASANSSSAGESDPVKWVLYVAAGAPPKSSSYLYTCTLPYESDPVAELKIKAQAAISANASLADDGIPTWAANVPDGLDYDLDTCFASNYLLNNSVDAYFFVGIKYIPPPAGNVTTMPPTTTTTTTVAPAQNSTKVTPRSSAASDASTMYFELQIFSSICQYFNPYNFSWGTDNCEVGPYTTPELTHCIFYKLAAPKPVNWTDTSSSGTSSRKRRSTSSAADKPMSFGAAMSVPTNTINLADSAFNHLDDNPLIFAVMISIVCMYLCLLVWAKRQDMLDVVKAGSSPLLDNDPRDQYLYELVVYTGQRSRAGTTSRVSIILSGEEDETPPRLVYDDKRPILQKGGVDAFVLAAPRSLGPLTMLRVWHNNSGKSPGWFFSRMMVTDLQTGAKYFFILNKWLAIEEDDAAIDRIVPVAGKEEMTSFNHLFWTKARKDLMDGHIWFSIFGRPHTSRFTRCQRLTVCLTLLFATMVANITFYQGGSSDASYVIFTFGSFSLSTQQLLTGLYSSLIIFPVGIGVMQMFRKAGDRPKTILLPKPKFDFTFLDDKDEDDADSSRISTSAGHGGLGGQGSGDMNDKTKKKSKKKFRLPWWIIYVAYGFSFGVVVVAIWYTVEIGGAFGPAKAQRWLVSFMTSFAESMLFSQPVKVVGLAVFFALFIKKPPAEGDIERDPALKRDETFLHQFTKANDLTDPEYQRQFDRYREIPLPPTEEYIRAARLQRQREMEMNGVLKEILLYGIFVTLLMMVGYGNTDPALNDHYRNIFATYSSGLNNPLLKPLPLTSEVMDITDVSKIDDFWMYLSNTLLWALHEQQLYDHSTPGWAQNFTTDLENVRVGPVRLRQLRVTDKPCPMPVYKYEKLCADDYLLVNNEDGDYAPGWVILNTSDAEQVALSSSAWQYRSQAELGGCPYAGLHGLYGGGGYALDLDPVFENALTTVAALQAGGWVDTRTRAVFVEFNLFNGNINMNTVSFIVFEFLSSGSVQPSFQMKPFRLDRYTGDCLFVILTQLLMLAYLIYFLVKECRLIGKLKVKYFKDLWNVYELAMLFACYVWMVLEVIRIAQAASLMAEYRANKSRFLNLQWAAYWNEMMVCYLGVLMFAATLKMLKLLRFNMRIVVLMKTIVCFGPPLVSFFMVFVIVFLAFASACYMIFVNYLSSYSSFARTCTSLLTMTLNKFNINDLLTVNPLMATLTFFGFVVSVNFIMINFMMTIIMDSFSRVKEEVMLQRNKYEMVQYIMSSVKAIIGLGKPPSAPHCHTETVGFVANTEGELSSRIEELMDKFVGIISSDPLQKSLLDTVEQRLKESKNNSTQAIASGRRVLHTT